MNQYLIWMNYGGTPEVPEYHQGLYSINSGDNMADAIASWAQQNHLNATKIDHVDGDWFYDGQPVSVVYLVDQSEDGWKDLRWE